MSDQRYENRQSEKSQVRGDKQLKGPTTPPFVTVSRPVLHVARTSYNGKFCINQVDGFRTLVRFRPGYSRVYFSLAGLSRFRDCWTSSQTLRGTNQVDVESLVLCSHWELGYGEPRSLSQTLTCEGLGEAAKNGAP